MNHHKGQIEVICGSMFSGKTEELIRRIRRATIADQNVMVFKHALDKRYNEEARITSHDGREIPAHHVASADEILSIVTPDTTVVAIDEVQFFEQDVCRVASELADNDMRVIIAGLDMDFRGEPFGPMPLLLCMAESITKLQAICVRCKELASRTQRLVDGNPAHYDDPIILVGAKESYEPRCRSCHQVPNGARTEQSERQNGKHA